jgi:transposase
MFLAKTGGEKYCLGLESSPLFSQHKVKKKEVMYMFYTGLDIHRKFIYGTVLDSKGKIVNQGEFSTTEADFDNFLGFLPNKQVKIVMESCGIWEDFYDLLESKGYDVCLANPLQVKAIASAKIKNDRVDSEVLARLLKADLIPKSYVPPKEVRELRNIIRHRRTLVKHRVKIRNNIHAILRKKNIKHPFKDLFCKKGIEYLKGMKDEKVDTFLRLFEAVEAEIKKVDEKLKENNTLNKEVNLLKTMPGIGEYAAKMIMSEIGDIKRFPSAKKLCNYAGIIPSQSQSADRDRRGSITKQGSKNLRWILVQGTHVAVSIPGKLQKYYYKLARRMPKGKAIIAVARKMLTIQWHMLTNKEPYLE